jgi:hypothetical protein
MDIIDNIENSVDKPSKSNSIVIDSIKNLEERAIIC